MKVIIIGPLKPIRGGITHSNEILVQNLSKKNEVITISFKRLFPKFLYPGKFVEEKKETKKNQLLDSINPINWVKTAKKINETKPQVIIFQWWTTFLFPCYFIISILTNAKKIAICQNVFPHEEGNFKTIKNTINTILTKIFFEKMNRLIAMSNSDKEKLTKLYPTKEIGLYLEPIYSIAKNKTLTKAQAKKLLGLKDKNIILFFGFVREYKGLKYLIQAMPKIKQSCNAFLLIVGEFWEDKKQYFKLISDLGVKDNIKIIDRYIPDKEVPLYFTASDIIALPYIDISESGIIRVAFGFDLPILATNVGGNPDHIENNFNGFLVEPKKPEQIAEKIIKFFNEKLQSKMIKAMRQKKKELEWSEEKEKNVLGNVE
ncbi:MAG: glycosyltransferase [Candidatus Diapherotrites archaeon]